MKQWWIVVVWFVCGQGFGQVKICSWNLCDMGKSKSDETITEMARNLNEFDVVALQEIVAGYGGAQSVAKLVDELNRSGAQWDYVVSDPTIGNRQKCERYAFLWKPSKVKIVGKPWLEKNFRLEIEREPFLGTFRTGDKEFTLVSFHAITKKLQPETEIKYFKFLPEKYPACNLIFAGDFNCPQSHTVFNPLKKMGYAPVFVGTKTTLKTKCTNVCVASEFDNFFYKKSSATLKNKGTIDFYRKFATMPEARKISDHLPIWAEVVF